MADNNGRDNGLPASGGEIDFDKLFEMSMKEEGEKESAQAPRPADAPEPPKGQASSAPRPASTGNRKQFAFSPDKAHAASPSASEPTHEQSNGVNPASPSGDKTVAMPPLGHQASSRPRSSYPFSARSQSPEPPAAMQPNDPSERPQSYTPRQLVSQTQYAAEQGERSEEPEWVQDLRRDTETAQDAQSAAETAQSDQQAGNSLGLWLETHRKPVIIGAAAVAAVVVAAAVAMGSTGQSSDDPTPDQQNSAPAMSSSSSQNQATTKTVTFQATADGWQDGTSTPLILHIAGTTTDGTSVDTYRAVPANGDSHIDMASGNYQIAAISPINSDGSIYTVPGSVSLTVDANDQTGSIVQIPLQLIAANDATQQQVESVLAQIQTAVNTCSSDSSAGDLYSRGADIVSQAAANAANSPAEIAASQSAQALEDGAESDAATANTSGDTGGYLSDSYDYEEAGDGSETPSVAASSAESSDQSWQSSEASSADGGDQAKSNPNASAGTAQETQGKTWHDPVTRTVHHEASTRQVYEKRSICNVCDADITGHEVEHTKAHAQAGEGGGWTTKEVATTIVTTPAYDSTEVVTPGGWW